MPLIKNDTFVDDDWVRVDADADLGTVNAEKVIVPFSVWEENKQALRGRNGQLGIVLSSDQSPELIADDLAQFALIALEFPVFKDGRGYSSARILRDRYDYGGELRAVGEVLRDQWYFMARCGFDAFEVAESVDLKDWTQALAEFSVPYQPASDDSATVFGKRKVEARA